MTTTEKLNLVWDAVVENPQSNSWPSTLELINLFIESMNLTFDYGIPPSPPSLNINLCVKLSFICFFFGQWERICPKTNISFGPTMVLSCATSSYTLLVSPDVQGRESSELSYIILCLLARCHCSGAMGEQQSPQLHRSLSGRKYNTSPSGKFLIIMLVVLITQQHREITVWFASPQPPNLILLLRGALLQASSFLFS